MLLRPVQMSQCKSLLLNTSLQSGLLILEFWRINLIYWLVNLPFAANVETTEFQLELIDLQSDNTLTKLCMPTTSISSCYLSAIHFPTSIWSFFALIMAHKWLRLNCHCYLKLLKTEKSQNLQVHFFILCTTTVELNADISFLIMN